MDNKISFKSNIRFVNAEGFSKISKLIGCSRIGYMNAADEFKYIDNAKSRLGVSKSFFTEKIRTCVGGGLVTPYKEAVGFHFFHSERYFNAIGDIVNKGLFKKISMPKRGLLIGGKNMEDYPYSLKNFAKLKSLISAKVKNLSIFECHKHRKSESHFHYSMKNDTWTIYSDYIVNDTKKAVSSLEDLKAAFKDIQIAQGDRLFIGETEILPKDCPKIFIGYTPKTDNKYKSVLTSSNFMDGLSKK